MLLALGAPRAGGNDQVDRACILVKAIVAANNDATATGHCTKGSGADTMVLPRNSKQMLTTINNTNYGPTGLPTIRSAITIVGNGRAVTRVSGVRPFRIFAVAEDGNLKLQKPS
ncbi:MAG TPA: hypothetical protein VHK27_00820 [Gammaproteobacteria bacterium]|nr:hypothetical protein [Gammaproteobacteria bacterium]